MVLPTAIVIRSPTPSTPTVPTLTTVPTSISTTTTTVGSTTTTHSIPSCGLFLEHRNAAVNIQYDGSDKDDGNSQRIRIERRNGLPFQDISITDIYVGVNGLISFNVPYLGVDIPTDSNSNVWTDEHLLAGYYTDLSINSTGNLYYAVYDVLVDQTVDVTVISTVKTRLETYYPGLQIDPTYVFVATWDKVPRYLTSQNSFDETATFQIIFASDGRDSFALYSYEDGSMNLKTGTSFIGYIDGGNIVGLFDSKDGSLLRRPDVTLTLGTQCRGGKIMKLTSKARSLSPEDICRTWFNKELTHLDDYMQMNMKMPPCPCSVGLLSMDTRYSIVNETSSMVIASLFPAMKFDPHGKTCAYDKSSNAFIQSHVVGSAGSFNLYNRIAYPGLHQLNDEHYKDMCCRADLCYLYYIVRPVGDCYSVSPYVTGEAFGDPHITTLDDQTYTFNGHGEYLLLNVNNSQLVIQCRTDKAIRKNGGYSDATIFTAFAVQGNGVWAQVAMNTNRTSVEVYAGASSSSAVDYTADFYSEEEPLNYVTTLMRMQRVENTLVTSFTETGLSFNVTLGNGLLQMDTSILYLYRNQTDGLMGNFNGDSLDDLRPRGEQNSLPSNSTDREIFHAFGQTWNVSTTESVFKYPNGKSQADFVNLTFVPQFLDEADPAVVANATVTCGEGQAQCIFDLVFTGNKELAEATNTFEAVAAANREIALNAVPTIVFDFGYETLDGVQYVFIEYNKPTTFGINATDDGAIIDIKINTTADVTKGVLRNNMMNITIIVTEQVTVTLIAEDNMNVYSPPLEVAIVFCPGCSDHGNCNYHLPRNDVNITGLFKYASCDCTEYWTGLNCEDDFDACIVRPCSVGRNCTDIPAAEHQTSQKGFICAPCPLGYTDDGDKCSDIDECSANTDTCQQICTNIDGSYTCSCSVGYRLGNDDYSCIDINECEEALNDCQQECSNSLGSYTCSCFEGFDLINSVCIQATPPDLCANLTCTSVDMQGCRVVDGKATCFCNPGCELSTSGDLCLDINECERSVCSQTCNNNKGSYTCSCYEGYSLDQDGTSCKACESHRYGVGCSGICQCSEQAERCDSIRGCICNPGWEGVNCESDINECDDTTICGGDSQCVNSLGSYQCQCLHGYSLLNGTCQDVNECEEPGLDTCQQTCTNTLGSFVCGCATGYVLGSNDSSQCVDLDECSSGVAMCEHICSNSEGRYSCECYFGYILNDDRQTCTKVEDPCTLFPEVSCSDICLVVDQKPVCSCNNGYKLGADNQTCIDIDECNLADLNKCSVKNSCQNSIGGHICSCEIGYKLDNDQRTCIVCDDAHFGKNCAKECNCGLGASSCDHVTGCVCKTGWTGSKCDCDIDECALRTSPCTADNTECVNNLGSYECRCTTGYTYEGGVCKDIDECQDASLHECDQTCTNVMGSYKCDCVSGFIKSGLYQCVDINECEGQHGCGQLCNNTIGSYRCSCQQGFKLDTTNRRQCIPISQCVNSDSCGSNALCTSIDGLDTCQCQQGYTFESGSSTVCTDILECATSPCDQTCAELPGSYQCACNIPGFKLDTDQHSCIECDENYYGGNCSEVCTCDSTNTQSCNKTDGTCTCVDGWTGEVCGTDIDECTEGIANCQDNSKCVNTDGSFSCQCNAGFILAAGTCLSCGSGTYGIDCAQTCQCTSGNFETCDPVDGTCTCKPGWTGSFCSQDVNECLNSNICGSVLKTCVNTVGSFRCTCRQGYSVLANNTCIDDQECLQGTDTCTKPSEYCTNKLGSFECLCSTGYSGTSPNCNVCDGSHWGVNCNMTCSCNDPNTERCDTVTGCVCKTGWKGEVCTEDINECEIGQHNCSQFSTCVNTQGHFSCICELGYIKNTNSQCAACSDNTFGNNCSENCDCDRMHTLDSSQSCDHVNGTCMCNNYWDGTRCDQDIDECLQGTSVCTGVNEGCHNTDGSYNCSCLIGYTRNGQNVCEASTQITTPLAPSDTEKVIGFTVRMNYSASASRNLSVLETYNFYKTGLEKGVSVIYNQVMGDNFRGLAVYNISFGSIVADIAIRIKDNGESILQYVNASNQLANGHVVNINNQTTTVFEITIDGTKVIPETSSCQYLEAASPCSSGSQCVIVNNKPLCQALDKDDKVVLYLGIGVSVALGVVAIIVLCIIVVYCCRVKYREHLIRTDLDDRDSLNQGFFPGAIPRKMSSWERAGPSYGPYV